MTYLVGGSISVGRDCDGHVLALRGVVLGGESQTSSYRHLCTHDTLSPEKVVLLGIEVHGPALALGGALLFIL